jgi:hypothetical protein
MLKPVRCTVWLLLLSMLLVGTVSMSGQLIFATLTGVVVDPSGATIPGANVTLTNATSGDVRRSVTNSDGFFTFASIAVGTYNVSIESAGFLKYEQNGISLGAAERRNIDVTMQVGSASEKVEVVAATDVVAPVDSGEKAATLTAKQMDNFIIVGSNAAEFIKIMPGFGISNGTANKSNYTGEVIGINANGDAGSQSPLNNAYSYNGLPGNSLDITADGAHVSDPGCNCDTPVNPNSDMVEEMKVLTSNFSAENQKGPAVMTSISKAGGQSFHGSAYFYARNYAMNANDWLNNRNGQARPENKYYYPGGTFSGPVIIPGTNFNKNRDKLFFFTGFQYYYQVLDTGLLRATVPTTAMINGDFSPASVAQLGTITASGAAAQPVTKYPGGIIPPSQIDPNMQAMMKLYPQPNADPNATNGYNYVSSQIFNQNNTQWLTRVDYSISDNTKVFVRYNYQRETQQFPVGLWWRNNVQVPYPTPIEGRNRSDSVSASLTHVFSPTLTNEFVFGYTFIGFPNVFEDPSKVDRTNVGYNYTGLYKNGVAQIPSIGGTTGESALIFNPGGFEAGGPSQGLYANKYMPSFSDTITKVWGTHTVKGGFFYEWIRNAQPANNNTNGNLQVSKNSSNPYTMGNEYADMLVGQLNNYNETSFNRVNDIAYTTYEFFVQDSWKVSRKLTLELGLRMSHMTPWYDRLGYGFSIFDYAQYSPTCQPSDYCGFLWHSKDSSVPLGGFPTRALFWQPRLGAAYDLTGKGNTVLRGGWGRFYYHAGQFTNGLDVAAGVQSINLGPTVNGQALYAKQLDTLNFTSQALSPAAVDSTDDKQAYTDSYSFTVSQRLPWSSLLEVAYVGNQTHDIPSSGNGGSANFNTLNINNVPVGGMFNQGVDPTTLNADNFRPLTGFSNLYLATNNARANYNAMQITWVRSRARWNVSANYTYGKAMGTVGFYDQFNLDNDYGVLASNRTHIFNTAYSVELGNPVKGNKLAGGVVNGWQLSGIVQWQSGPNLSALQGQNFGMNTNGYVSPVTGYVVNNTSVFGTPNLQLNPVLTCDPTANLKAQQYINSACFSVPTNYYQGGPNVMKPMYGPAFFNWDMGLFKNFAIKEKYKVQFRANFYNFLNHPLWSFNGSNLNLGFDKNTGLLNTPNFGITTDKQGHRVIQLAVKFYF